MKQITQQAENKFALGEKVIVNTGGKDTIAHIDMPTKNIHGYYWKEQGLYLCRFIDNPKNLLCNGAIEFQGGLFDASINYVHKNAQYIPTNCIRPFSEQAPPTKEVIEDDALRMAYQSADMQDYENKTGTYATKEVFTDEWEIMGRQVNGNFQRGIWYKNKSGDKIAAVYGETEQQAEANAQRIVLCHNNHDALVSALQTITNVLTDWNGEGKYQNLIEHAKTALTSIK